MNEKYPHRRVSSGFPHDSPGRTFLLGSSPSFTLFLDSPLTGILLIRTSALSLPAGNPILGNTSVRIAGNQLMCTPEHRVILKALSPSIYRKIARLRTG